MFIKAYLNVYINNGGRMETIERELKYQIDSAGYAKMLKYLNKNCTRIKTIIQKNYYIDDENFIFNKLGITARIREKNNGNVKFTLKIPEKQGDISEHRSVKKEISIDLQIPKHHHIDDKIIDSRILSLLSESLNISFNQSKLSIIGTLETERILYKINGVEDPIIIDRSSYFQAEDYEIEWETSDLERNNEILMDIFNKAGIEYLKSTKSKSKRFVDVLISGNHNIFK